MAEKGNSFYIFRRSGDARNDDMTDRMRNMTMKHERNRGTPGQLFRAFLKIGAFTFGGGYAMIPLIQREVVDDRHWVSEGDILDVVAIAETTPGPIAINAATFIGRRVAGIPGALCATLGVVLPSLCIIVAVSYALEAFRDLRAVRYAFWGIRAGVLALILRALWSLYRQCKKDWFSRAIMALAFVAAAFLRVNAIAVIAACAALGIAARCVRGDGR